MDLVIKSLKKEFRVEALFYISFLSILILLAVWHASSKGFFFYISCLLMLPTVVYLFKTIKNLKQINNTFLIKLLTTSPTEIVWVYSILTQRMPFGLQTTRQAVLYFKLLNRAEISLEVAENDLPTIMLYLNLRLPHAAFGYNPERAQWYLVEPALLLQDEI